MSRVPTSSLRSGLDLADFWGFDPSNWIGSTGRSFGWEVHGFDAWQAARCLGDSWGGEAPFHNRHLRFLEAEEKDLNR